MNDSHNYEYVKQIYDTYYFCFKFSTLFNLDGTLVLFCYMISKGILCKIHIPGLILSYSKLLSRMCFCLICD